MVAYIVRLTVPTNG